MKIHDEVYIKTELEEALKNGYESTKYTIFGRTYSEHNEGDVRCSNISLLVPGFGGEPDFARVQFESDLLLVNQLGIFKKELLKKMTERLK